jgi:hypothetical protein
MFPINEPCNNCNKKFPANKEICPECNFNHEYNDFDTTPKKSLLLSIKKFLRNPKEPFVCKLVIPGTFICCGEDGNYCSKFCQVKGWLK